tara:strand:+ start:187 stop:426 length:240 start_codon:yes stop_codon:yes gene_type:complete
MIKIVMAIIITSMPHWPSVRYQGYIYPDMETCIEYNEIMIKDFKSYARSQGDNEIHFESFCFEADSYPIEGFNKIELGI